MEKHRTKWTEGNGSWNLMKKGDEIIKIEDGLLNLALAQGAEEIEDEFIELSQEQIINLGLS